MLCIFTPSDLQEVSDQDLENRLRLLKEHPPHLQPSTGIGVLSSSVSPIYLNPFISVDVFDFIFASSFSLHG